MIFKKRIISILLMIIFLTSLIAEENIFPQLIRDIKKGSSESIEKSKIQLLEFKAVDKVDVFKKHYLLSFCYFSDLPEKMMKVDDNLQKSLMVLKSLDSKSYDKIFAFLSKTYSIFEELISFKDFEYEDLENVINNLINQFQIKVEIAEILENYNYASNIKSNLRGFSFHILEGRKKDSINKMLYKLDSIIMKKPAIIDTRRN